MPIPPNQNDLTNNSLMPECIRVTKVYDWISDVNSYKNKTSIPEKSHCKESCSSKVREALEAHHDLRVECSTPEVPPVFPLKEMRCSFEKFPHHYKDKYDRFTCEILEIENGNPGKIRVLWTVFVEMKIFDDTKGKLLCKFDVPVQFDEEYMICIPAPLDKKNISCRITKIFCKPTNRVLLGDLVQLKVTICKEIQVEAEVKMEVMGKFCQPRPNDIPLPPKEEDECPDFEFPPQCPGIFPRPNCDCQAEALVDKTTGEGEDEIRYQLNALICDNCTLSQSTWSFTQTDSDGITHIIPRSIEEVTCDDTGDSVEITGLADIIGPGGNFSGVEYTLTLNDDDSFQLVAGSFETGEITIDDADEIIVEDCLTFEDIIDSGNISE